MQGFILFYIYNLHLLFLSVHLKQIAWTIFLISGTILLYLYLGDWFKSKSPTGRNTPKPGEQTKQLQVLEYGSNRIGDIDKFLVEQSGHQIWLHFPPHTASYIMHIAVKNSIVDASFLITGKKTPDNRQIYDLVSVKTRENFFSVQDIPPPPPTSGTHVELSGKIIDYKLDENGSVAGFTMDSSIIEIPKHIPQNIVPMLQHADSIIVKGYQRNNTDGFVNTTGLTLIKPYAITIDKTNYLL